MFRMLLVTAIAYAGYRVGRSFVDDVPDGFETIPPAPDAQRKTKAKRNQ